MCADSTPLLHLPQCNALAKTPIAILALLAKTPIAILALLAKTLIAVLRYGYLYPILFKGGFWFYHCMVCGKCPHYDTDPLTLPLTSLHPIREVHKLLEVGVRVRVMVRVRVRVTVAPGV